MTNATQTTRANFTEVGPLIYRVNTQKLNIVFSSDNTLVTFQRQK